MSLTFGGGPLTAPEQLRVNYRVEGPEHRLFAHPFPRRVRARAGGQAVLDTTDGLLVHETGHLPVLYVPDADLATGLLEPSGHRTHCPFKGDASYRHLAAGGRTVENAVWAYREPLPAAAWLEGLASLTWTAADTWLDEDEEVQGHLRDPYHRVDVRRSGRHVVVRVGGETVAETTRPALLSETGLPNRFYLPADDVRDGVLVASETTSVCPYKGTASYWHARVGDRRVDDAAWAYPHPLENALGVAGHVCFSGDAVETEVDGEVVG
jgi:uncharacterized protein (DUF427 family)